MLGRILTVATVAGMIYGFYKFGTIAMVNSPLCRFSTCDALTYMTGGLFLVCVILVLIMISTMFTVWLVKG